MSWITITWLICSCASARALWYFFKCNDEEFTISDLFSETEPKIMMGLALAFPAFFLIGCSVAIVYQSTSSKLRRRARNILRSWEFTSCGYDKFQVKPNSLQPDEVYALMRAGARLLPIADLKFLSGLSKEIYDIDKVVMDAILDELVERELLR